MVPDREDQNISAGCLVSVEVVKPILCNSSLEESIGQRGESEKGDFAKSANCAVSCNTVCPIAAIILWNLLTHEAHCVS